MSFHPGQTFTFGEQPSATKWQWVWDNDDALADGSGIEDDAIIARHIADDVINTNHIDWSVATGKIWHEELGRTTLGGAADSITISSFTAREHLRILIFTIPTGGTTTGELTFNNDTGGNYSRQSVINNAAAADALSQNSIGLSGGASAEVKVTVIDISNVLAQEKLGRATTIESGGAGAGSAPDHSQQDIKWANTAAQITRIDLANSGTGDFAAGSRVIVLGHD